MGIPVLVIGESGSGKTYSVKNLDPEKVGIFLCEKNRLPFRKKFTPFKVRNYQKEDENKQIRIIRQSVVIQTMLLHPRFPKKIYVIDDSQYIMANEFFDRANEKGYDKYSQIGTNFFQLLETIRKLPNDKIVYLMHHIEFDDSGREKQRRSAKW